MKLANFPREFHARDDMVINEHFTHFVSTDLWTAVLTDSGTATVGDEVGGVLTIAASDGTAGDNDEAYVRTTAELFKILDDRLCYAEALIQYTEAATDDANVLFGFMNAVAANHLLDDGAGPAASYSGAVIFKVDGGTVWQCESSLAGSQTTTVTTATAGGSSWQRLAIAIQPLDTTVCEVQFEIDGNPFRDSANSVIKHRMTYTNATEMHLVVGLKAGSATAQTMKVDLVRAIMRGIER